MGNGKDKKPVASKAVPLGARAFASRVITGGVESVFRFKIRDEEPGNG